MQNENLNDNEINTNNINTIEETETGTIQEEPQTQVTLETIHNDLGMICTFLSLASIVVFSVIIYKFFRIFF